MRSEEEVQHVFDNFDVAEESELMASWGDNFKYGYWSGKLVALEWVLGGPLDPVKIHHDFESYILEFRASREEIPPPEEAT